MLLNSNKEHQCSYFVNVFFSGRPISVDWAVAKNKYMQHVVNQQFEMEENIKKEESDSDDDNTPLNVTSDDVKDEVKSESELFIFNVT